MRVSTRVITGNQFEHEGTVFTILHDVSDFNDAQCKYCRRIVTEVDGVEVIAGSVEYVNAEYFLLSLNKSFITRRNQHVT